MGSLISMVALFSAISMFADVPAKVDPWIHTEAEAKEEHHQILMAEEQTKQTQAGFNAYTLRLLLAQEISILELQIDAEEDEDEKKLLEVKLVSKYAFIEQLELEERKQMLIGGGT